MPCLSFLYLFLPSAHYPSQSKIANLFFHGESQGRKATGLTEGLICRDRRDCLHFRFCRITLRTVAGLPNCAVTKETI